MMTAALVTTPALAPMPPTIGVPGGRAGGPPLADPAEDEDVVVHAQPEQDDEHEQRQPADHPAVRREAQHRARWPSWNTQVSTP